MRAAIDLERGGLGASDEDGLVELVRPVRPIPSLRETKRSLSPPPLTVAHDSVFDRNS